MAQPFPAEDSVLAIPVEVVARRIFVVRGHKVMLDADLADLYQVETRVLNQAVRRNRERFPEDFMFEINEVEVEILRSQTVISSWGGRRYLPYAFTEQGVAMLSSVLKSPLAVQVNIAIMRTFVRLRELTATHRELAEKITNLERQYAEHDTEIEGIFEAIRRLLEPPESGQRRRIGFAQTAT